MGKPIGVLGCSGTVGKNVTEKLLRQGYAVLGGQRSENCPFLTRTGFQFCRMDMENPAQLLAFCQACSAVVNCTAPFSRYGAKVARAAGASGAIYIDGADFLLQEKELPQRERMLSEAVMCRELQSILRRRLHGQNWTFRNRSFCIRAGQNFVRSLLLWTLS